MSLLGVRPDIQGFNSRRDDDPNHHCQRITTAGRYLSVWPKPEQRRRYWEVKGILGGHFIGSDTLSRGRTEYFKNYKPCQYSKLIQTKMSLTFFAKCAKIWELF